MKISYSYQPSENFCSRVQQRCKQYFNNTHLYCKNSSTSNGPIPKPVKVKIGREVFLNMVNEFRNILACGYPEMKNMEKQVFPKAARLPKVVWDEELEWVANLNAKACSNSIRCPFSENFLEASPLFHEFSEQSAENVTNNIAFFFQGQFAEYTLTPIGIINKYNQHGLSYDSVTWNELESALKYSSLKFNIASKVIRSSNNTLCFAKMVLQNTKKIGCAYYRCNRTSGKKSYKYTSQIYCVFESYPRNKEFLYERSEIGGSRCPKKSKQFCCLCLQPGDKESFDQCFKSELLLPFNSNTKSGVEDIRFNELLVLVLILNLIFKINQIMH